MDPCRIRIRIPQKNLPVDTNTPTGNGSLGPNLDALELSDLVRIVRRQRWWIAGVFSSVLLVTALFTFLQAPVYRAETTLRVEASLPAHMEAAFAALDFQAARGERAADDLIGYAAGLAHSPPGARPGARPMSLAQRRCRKASAPAPRTRILPKLN